jgi:hypothetical protein
VGHALAGTAAVVADGVLADEVSVWDPHAESVMTNGAAQATIATGRRGKFTLDTLQRPRCSVNR